MESIRWQWRGFTPFSSHCYGTFSVRLVRAVLLRVNGHIRCWLRTLLRRFGTKWVVFFWAGTLKMPKSSKNGFIVIIKFLQLNHVVRWCSVLCCESKHCTGSICMLCQKVAIGRIVSQLHAPTKFWPKAHFHYSCKRTIFRKCASWPTKAAKMMWS